jgi:hypothetical protein
MTKVADASTADGSSSWFKIKEIGPKFPGGTWDMSQSYSVAIPSCVVPGDYLVRIEQLAIHNPGSTPQFYIACGMSRSSTSGLCECTDGPVLAQVKVTGSGSKTFSGVSIPGHVKASDPGYTANIYNNFNSYTVPGPKVSTC